MIRKSINKFPTELPKKGAFTIETDDDFPRLHTLAVASGRRGGGKSVAISNFLKRCKDKHYYDKIFLITPTYNSNKSIWDICDIPPEDVIEPDENAIKEVVKKIEADKQEWEEFLEKKKKYEMFLRDKGTNLQALNSKRLLMYYNLGFLEPEMNEPEWKYPIEQPPRIAVVIDDAMGTDLLAKRSSGLINFCIKHRHIADGLGCSVFMLVQSYKAQGGVNRAIRENTTHLLLFKVNDFNQIKAIKEESDLPVTEEEFENMCSYAHAKPFNFLLLDFAYKCETKRFRSGWDEYIIPPSLQGKCSCKK
tara:strand:+ start:8106 stop:9023 length:918 start_codon:yes stop_codon:yes gene_type:complete